MARIELIMPKMGESVSEATIISWTKKVGEMVELDETIIEIATDKVDSEVPSTHEGKLVEQLFKVDDVVQVGDAFAIIETDGSDESDIQVENITQETVPDEKPEVQIEKEVKETIENVVSSENKHINSSKDRFYSPLVRNMATQEGISQDELDKISGSGKNNRVTKQDMIVYLENRNSIASEISNSKSVLQDNKTQAVKEILDKPSTTPIHNTGEVEIVEMDRMRKLISAHMTMSKATSAHITSFR